MNTNQIILTDQGDNYVNLWSHVAQDLYNHYGETLYNSWFSKVNFIESSLNTVILCAPTNFVRDWIKSKYSMVILQLFQHYNNTIKSIDIITKELPGTTQTVIELPTKTFADIGSSELNSENIFSTLDVRFTFDNFVVGAPNELAYAAARAVAESSGAVSESNPLFLYGGVGLGKTHLMHAIGWYIKQNNPSRKVIYMSAEKFMYQFVKALRNKEVILFKEKFRSVDVLMIDDIQFICGKDSTQEEFFHTFNTLIDNNRQMVISCDRSPSDLDNIEDRIKSRLGWGLVADVHSTTYELRLGILESKIEQMNVKIPKDVIDFLASKIVSNVRELEGALNKVIAHSNFTLKEITLENTQNILRDLLRSNERIITVEDIQKKVASRYNIKLSDMSSSRRLREVARPRQIAMYLSKALTLKSLADIGKKFGKKDHTTVMYAIKKVEELLENDIELREEINLLMKILQH
ncbi:chromosomal replication initiation protein [Rickettsia akari str. Hartford]|uniref:Chromosomal replication initiator protein DnaA n=2 Tax=Rickettsia akari TaxID=786 RepID=DNAA_RICAH|nr:chromosomal replication initiator protein DnaA [Rickettsia akari]A8GP75.1 RecName: Full=Chromosomal replication initiator protein DnaA [Rickettsia akari str. Hartford]ABV75200.1 chromosomal replication initiation protein [Rickettsia akari str. Hartford]